MSNLKSFLSLMLVDVKLVKRYDGPGDKWKGEGDRSGSSYSLETDGHNRKMISKVFNKC